MINLQLYLLHIARMLSNLVTAQKLGNFWNQIELKKLKTVKSAKNGRLLESDRVEKLKTVRSAKNWATFGIG